jgi:hypothetical protein
VIVCVALSHCGCLLHCRDLCRPIVTVIEFVCVALVTVSLVACVGTVIVYLL